MLGNSPPILPVPRGFMLKILSVSYDQVLLITRQRILESKGYTVTSARGARDALQHCNSDTPFALFILGHSIPHVEKEALIEYFRANRPAAPIIARKRAGEEHVRGANLEIEPRPLVLLDSVATLIRGEGTAA
jgi:CheY-like chemotaxis protein